MYDLPYHKEKNEVVIERFIRDYPFALLTGCDAQGKPVATQVPVFMENRDGSKVLRGHMMRKTDHHSAFVQNENVLAVFTGPNVYVSGTWYRDPHTPSTWNYMTVHARGHIQLLDSDSLIKVLRDTSLYFEGNDKASPTIYDNLSKKLTDKLVKAIVAFEVEVTDIDAVFKLSQDRDLESYQNVIKKLKAEGEAGRHIAAAMANNMKNVFSDDESL